MEGREPEATGETAESNTPLPSRMELRQVTELGVTLDGEWITWEFLEELQEQGVYDSQFGGALLVPNDRVRRVLEARGLLERETRGGVHRGPALAGWMIGVEFPESNTSSTPPVPSPLEAEPRPYRKFNVLGWVGADLEAMVKVRCWVCGQTERFGGRDATGLEELTEWARAHECPRMSVPDDVRSGGFWHPHLPEPGADEDEGAGGVEF